MRRKTAVFISIVVARIIMTTNPGYALNEETHARINEAAAATSTLDSFLKTRLGLLQGIGEPFQRGTARKSVSEWLAEGGQLEDSPFCRPTRHFHDPLQPWNSAGLSTSNRFVRLTCGSDSFPSSIHWSQDPNQSIGGKWSWHDARRFFFSALTSSTKNTREQGFADTFRALGQLMHLVADASVPEHVRNDPHILEAACQFFGQSCMGSYEYWVSYHRDSPIEGSVGFDSTLLAPPTGDAQAPLPIARLIDSDLYAGLATGPNVTKETEIGIAEFANANFFSEDTADPDGPYPFPDFVRLKREELPIPRNGVRAYYRKDPQDGVDVKGPVLAECVLDLAGLIEGRSAPGYYCPDDSVWETTANVMLPRAVGYAAGILDYFFRGHLKGALLRVEGSLGNFASPPYTVELRLTNESAENMEGDFRLYADAPNGTRTQLAGPEIDSSGAWTQQSLARGTTRTFSFTVPEGFGVVAQFLVVFRGRLGLEQGAVAGGIVDPAEFLEAWDRGLTGRHPWAHSTQTPILGTNQNNGVSTNQVVAGRLVKDNNRVAGNGNARFNQSFVGPIIRDGVLIRDFQDVLPVPITSRTVVQVKIDDISVNEQPPCQAGSTCAHQVLQFVFTGGRYIQLSVPGQGVNFGGSGVFIDVTPQVPVTFNIHDVFTRAGIPVDNLVLGSIVVWQQLHPYFDPATGTFFDPDPLPRQQRMKVDYIWVSDVDSARDTDADGLPDVFEVQNGLDPLNPTDATADPDRDGLTNLAERTAGGDPNNPDTDGDGLPDGLEVAIAGTALAADPAGDFDRDGASNLNEVLLGCNPLLLDVTTVTGRTVDERGNPVAEASVQVVKQSGSSGRTDAQGGFSLAGVAACPPSIQVVANAQVGGTAVQGKSPVVSAVVRGSTNVGDIVLSFVERPLYPGPRLAAGLNPRAVAAADLNGDGHPDIVTANGESDDISVLLGNGDGSFQPQQRFAAGRFPRSMAVADLNGDGLLDVVTAIAGGNVSVLLGNGNGSFGAPQFVTVVAGGSPSAVAVADLNKDGFLDLVTVNGISRNFSVLLGNGDGTFRPEQRFAVGTNLVSIAVADFNRDGNSDLVIGTSGTFSGDVSVFLGNGDGTFQPEQRLAGFGATLAVADLNGDSFPDLVTTNTQGASLSVLVGNGDGTFQPEQRFFLSVRPRSIAVADLNSDGLPDVVTVNIFDDNVSVLLGNGDGTLQAEEGFAAGPSPTSLVVADLNGDSLPDVVTANSLIESVGRSDGVSVLLGNGDGTFQIAQPIVSASLSIVADIDRDGRPDIVAMILNPVSNTISVLLSNGDGTFQAERLFAVGLQPVSVAVADLNGDSIPDVVTANFGPPGGVSVLLGNGNGTFQPDRRFAVSSGPFAMAVGDLNGDGRVDLALANSLSDDVSVLLGNGDGTFQPPRRFAVGDFPRSVLATDLNGDGATDLAAVNGSSGDISVLLGNSDGTFQPQRRFAVGTFPGSVFAADLNGDGATDLVTANESSNEVSVLLGNGDGTFQAERRFIVGYAPTSVAAADLNGDGVIDLVTANGRSGDVSVLLGNGDGTFQPEQRFIGSGGGFRLSITVADLDLDGFPDLLTAGSVLFHQGR